MNLKLAEFLTKIIGDISPRLQFSLAYFHNRGCFPNLRNPKNLSEIIGKQMITGEINQFAPYVDKIEVRKYIEKWGLGEYLPKLYGTWNKFEDIDFNTLPNKFALKTNNGCGSNIICFDKKNLDIEKARKVITDGLKIIVGGKTETQYALIKPRILAEELLSENDELPIDYKFHCFNGKVKGILLCLERSGKDGLKLLFYDTNWKREKIFKDEEANYDVKRPEKLEEMLKISSLIASKFKQVRVDLYFVNNKIYIGELTFTPHGGLLRYFTMEGLEYLGE